MLIPYAHYVPVRPSLSDLVEKVRFFQKYEIWASLMAQELLRFGREVLDQEYSYWYLHTLLLGLARQQAPLFATGLFD